ncbi:MAG: hypothetical protein ACYCSF_02840 [Acidimicrobiales bacterium]
MAAESVNASLSGGFVDMARGFFRVFGLPKITVLLGFTIAAVNLDRIRSFEAKRAESEQQPKRRRRIRFGSWQELTGHLSEAPALSSGPAG